MNVPLPEAILTLEEEKPDVYRRWIRDGAANVRRLGDTNDSQVDNLLDVVLNNPNPIEQDAILSYTIDYTLKIQFNFDRIERAEHLLEVGSETRKTVRDQFGEKSAAQHSLEARRPTFTRMWPDSESIEEHHICTQHPIVNYLSSRLQQSPETVLARTEKYQSPIRLERFENPSANIGTAERINNFQRAARLFTLIGNVTDFSFNEGVEIAIDYFEAINTDEFPTFASA